MSGPERKLIAPPDETPTVIGPASGGGSGATAPPATPPGSAASDPARQTRPLPAHGGAAAAAESGFAGNERYQVLRRLGEGGMGTVYAAFDRRRAREVAIKVLRDPERGSLYRFKREFRAAADLVHPNLVRLYDLGVLADGSFFFTMELIAGHDLVGWVRQNTPRAEAGDPTVPISPPTPDSAFERDETARDPAADIAAVLAGVADGLLFLHRARKIHRDLKPSNVVVGRDGRPRLLDFGILRDVDRAAGLTRENEAVGTPLYMAPEQVIGRDVGPPADVYALGCVLYEVLAGRPPFVGPIASVAMRHLQNVPDAPSTHRPADPDLEELCLELLAKDPAERPDAEAVRERLWRRAGRPPGPVEPPPRQPPGLIGREPELRALDDALAAAGSAPQIVLVAGESGAGKSALAAELADRVQTRGGAAWFGRCYEREHVPYRALDAIVDEIALRLVRGGDDAYRLLPPGTPSLVRIFPVLREASAVADMRPETPLADAQADRLRAVRALFGLIRNLSGEATPLVVIDDLQWADADSVDVLQWLARADDAPAALVVATYRPEEVGEGHPMAPLLAASDRVRRLPLPPLAPESLGELVRAWATSKLSAAQCARLAEESQGNPFLAVELARAASGGTGLGDTLPTVAELVERRLEGASKPARRVLEVVAIAAGAADFPLLVAATGLAPAELTEAIDELLRGQLLREVPGPRGSEAFDLAHDRLRRAGYEAIALERRRALHRTIGEHLAERGDAAGAVDHWQRAGEQTQAREAALDAARRAEEQLAFNRAAELYALAQTGGEGGRGELELARARALARAGRHADAARALRAAAAGAPEEQARELRVDAAIEHIAAGEFAAGMDGFEGLLAAYGIRLRRHPFVRLIVTMFYMVRVMAGWMLDDGRCRLRGGRRAEPRPMDDDTRFQLRLFDAVGQRLGPVDPFAGNEIALKHAVIARRYRDPVHVGRARIGHSLRLLGMFGIRAGRSALRHLHEGEAFCAEAGDKAGLLQAQMVRGFLHLLDGTWAGVRAAVERGESLARRHGLYGEPVLTHLHSLHIAGELFAGDPLGVITAASGYLADARDRGNVVECVEPLLMIGLARLWLGDGEAGRAAIDEGIALVPEQPLTVLRTHAELFAASVDVYDEDTGRGYARLDDLARRCHRHGLFLTAMERATFEVQRRRLELLELIRTGRVQHRCPALSALSRFSLGGLPSTFKDEALRLDAAFAFVRGRPARALRRLERALRLGEKRHNRMGLALALAARATLRRRLDLPGADFDRECARELMEAMNVRAHYLVRTEGWDDPFGSERSG